MFDTEHIIKTYFKMAIPVVISLVITLVYNIVDTLFISATNNSDIIAGVSYCGPLFTLLMAFGNIFGSGGSSLVSRLLGKKETESVKKVWSFCWYGALATSVVVLILMLSLRPQILGILGAKEGEGSYQYAWDYYTWLGIGSPLIICSFIHGNLVRCEGYANHAMIGNIIGTVVNICLDAAFILGLGMGAKGAAIATIIGYGISTIYFMVASAFKSKFFTLNPKYAKCSLGYIGSILGIGLTVAITNIMQTVSNTVLNNFLNPFVTQSGPNPIAAMGVVLKISLISQLINSGFTVGAIPVFGYLFGENNKKKIKQLTLFNVYFLGGISIVITLLLGCAAEPLCQAFFSTDPATVKMAATMLRWIAVGTLFMTGVLLMATIFQSGGKMVPALIMSISRQGVVFIIMLLILNATCGYTGILATQAVSDVISFVIGIVVFYFSFRNYFKNGNDEPIEKKG